jgi:hypothetical protein
VDITEAAVVPTPRLRVETAVTLPRVAAAEATPHLPAVAVPTPLRAEEVVVAVAVAIPHLVVVAVEAAATVPVAVAIVPAAAPMAADDTKLTYEQGHAAGTSTQPAAAPAFLLASYLIPAPNVAQVDRMKTNLRGG